VLLVLLPATAASAHVRVIPDATSTDGFAKVTFRVPNESPTAGTTTVAIALPTTTPFTSVTYLPVVGWKADVVIGALPTPVVVDGATLTRAPLQVVWTADANVQIPPGAFQEFSIMAGPMPTAGTSVLLPATQTYSDGSVVVWDQVAKDGAAEPEYPAPILVAPAAQDTTATPAAAANAAPADPLARWLGGLGVALGSGGLVLLAVLTRRAAGRVQP
jgi:uncharacterized protein YcnI